jgi:hypothetical protein
MLDKNMYRFLMKVKRFTKANNERNIDGKKLESFRKENQKMFDLSKQAGLIYETQHDLSIKGPGYMALAYYKSDKGNKRREWVLIVIAIATLIMMFKPYIMLFF